jgi:predicted TIM-barrel fold metal-dependent hydrolase
MTDFAPLFDSDQHYYEPRDCFTRYIAKKDLARAIRVERDADGRDAIWVGERPFTFLDWDFDRYARPGALREMLRGGKGAGGEDVVEPLRPEYHRRDARLERLDQQGIESSLLFPTLAVCVEHFMKDDPSQMALNLHAFNRWLLDDWGFGRDGRIIAVPLLSLVDLSAAVKELDWLLAEGARIVSMRPGPAYGRSPADPYFDPIWARLDEARVPVAYHIGESGYNELFSVAWGEQPNPSSHRQSAFQWTNFYGDRPIMDTVSALVFHNLFGRFPNVNIASVENGSAWVAYIMRTMDKMGGMGRNGPWIGGRIHEKPSRILRRHLFVSPYHEDDIEGLAELIGPSQVLFGSDFPHPEGLAEPLRFRDEIPNLPADQVGRIMGANGRALVGLT